MTNPAVPLGVADDQFHCVLSLFSDIQPTDRVDNRRRSCAIVAHGSDPLVLKMFQMRETLFPC